MKYFLSTMPVRHRLNPFAVACCCVITTSLTPCAGQAQTSNVVAPPETILREVVVKATPEDTVNPAEPTQTLRGEALALRQASSLGTTLDGLPGVAATQFGPNASRPVVRGMEGDRLRILQNGAGAVDASNLSYDHAVPLEPLVAEHIELIRGPASLLYGTNALGGAVNFITNQIPREAIQGVQGKAETRLGGAEQERAAAALVETGNGQWAVHADASVRKTSDLRIPGYARSATLRASDPQTNEAYGTLPNSAAEQQSGAVGVAYTGQKLNLGIGYSGQRSEYGTVAEEAVRIRMQQDRVALDAEARNVAQETGGLFDNVRAKLNLTDYEHRELDAGVVGTTFKNRGWEGRVEARHAKLRHLDGVLGVQVARTEFSALGDEAFVPSSRTTQGALFALEEWRATERLKLSLSGRMEHAEIQASADGKPQFDDARRRFTGYSSALGASYAVLPGLRLTSQLATTQRLPTFYELYANGPHIATGAYEVGNAHFGKETARMLEFGLHWKAAGEGVGMRQASVRLYGSDIDQYIALVNSGAYRLADGTVVAAGTPEALPEMLYQGVAARFVGFEAETTLRLAEQLFGVGKLDWQLRSDLTRATRRDTGEALPRIAPFRFGSTLSYRQAGWSAQLEAHYHARQSHVPQGDTPTAAYTTLGLALTYQWRWQGLDGLLFLKGENLSNAEIRQATSILREIAPQGGRSVRAGLRVNF